MMSIKLTQTSIYIAKFNHMTPAMYVGVVIHLSMFA